MPPFFLFDRRGMRALWRSVYRYLFGKRGARRVHGLRLLFRLRTNALLLSRQRTSRLLRGLSVRFWVDGENAFRRIERRIRRAKHSIIIEMFIWKDDSTGRRMAELLVEAADRGVVVDITKESTGDMFELSKDFAYTKERKSGIWKKFWSHEHIHVEHATDDNHAKAYVFDGEILLLTGMNIADEYRFTLHDYLVELRGTHFVEEFLTGSKAPERNGVQLVLNRGQRREVRAVVENLIRQAKRSIVVEMAYFSDPAIIDLLAERSGSGIRVTVIIPRQADIHQHANLRGIERLLEAGEKKKLQVLQFPQELHGKLLLIDRQTALVGSLNLMASSLDHMGEANVLIGRRHRWALQKIRTMLRSDIAKSTPIKSPPRLRWLGRWLAWLGL